MNTPYYLIAGLGKTGHSIARYLRRRNQAFGVFDTRSEPQGLAEFKQEFPAADVFLNHIPETLYDQLTAIISSPGVALENQNIQKAAAKGIAIYGDIECLAREVKAPIIAITGTNGKSTVTTLVGEMAKAQGLNVAVAGNIGAPVLDLLDDENEYDLWVLELSSFQLDLTYSLAPIAATILNITPDHLDRHHTFQAYCIAKQRIYQQTKWVVYNRDDKLTAPNFSFENDNKITFGLNQPIQSQDWGLVNDKQTTCLAQGNTILLPVGDLRIKGQHNWSNALAAAALAEAAGINRLHIMDVLRQFPGLPHRSQWLRTIDNVEWINDSKGTNVGATMSAISGIGSAIRGKIVLIAGGQGKGADFNDLRQPIADHVRAVILIGEDANKIAEALTNVVPLIYANSLEKAAELAKLEAQSGDVVLLSPACASFDMFRDFNHRGEQFKAVVDAL